MVAVDGEVSLVAAILTPTPDLQEIFIFDMWRGNIWILNAGGREEGEDSFWLGSIEILNREVSFVVTLLNPCSISKICSYLTCGEGIYPDFKCRRTGRGGG